MAKSATFSNEWLLLIFNGTAIPNIAANATTSPLANIYVALHTADPTASGNQSTSEAAYTSYARVAVPRTTSGWVVSGNSVSPVSPISFPAGTGGTGTANYWSAGFAFSGAAMILYSGPVSPTIAMGSGVTPILSIATAISEF